ncbi:FHA domain-containing protein [Gordonia sp. NPDC003429]
MSGPGLSDVPSVIPTVTLVPGSGIVIRKPAFLCVLGAQWASLVPQILALEESVAVPDRRPRRGRHMVRALAQLVATIDDENGEPVDIAFAAPDNVGIAIYLSGAMTAEIDGQRLTPDGDEAFDRAIPWPFEGLGLYVAGTEPAEPGEEMFALVEGAVPAAGALLHTPLGMRGTEIHDVNSAAPPPLRQVPASGASEPVAAEPVAAKPVAPEPMAPEPEAPEPEAPEPVVPEPVVAEPVAPEPFVAASLMAGDAATPPVTPAQPAPPQAEAPPPPAAPAPPPAAGGAFQLDSLQSNEVPEPRAPLPKQERQRPATEVVRVVESRAHVHGIRCSRGHLNHPRSWLCGVCGIRMDQLTGILVEGERPPLGWLLLDNGSTYLLDEDLVLGREPGSVGGARTGSPKPIRVQDESGQLSRRHVEIRLVEWSVQLIDLGSANGTFVSDPAAGNREIRLPAHQVYVLTPGSHVRLGGRHFIFESPHART